MNGPRDPQRAQEIQVCHLGLVPYRDGIAIQERLRERRIADEIPDTLLLLEHPPTFTRGRRAAAEELPFGDSFYRDRGAEVHATDRGGRVTYHGPGQLIGYPIMSVTDVHGHLRTMEEAIIEALSQAGVEARSRHAEGIDYTGVWVSAPGTPRGNTQVGNPAGARKIASLGVHIQRGISTHGFAVNVENDLTPFSWVIACGLPDVTMTSLALETQGAGTPQGGVPNGGRPGEGLACFRRRMAYAFCSAHGRRQRLVTPARLGIAPPGPSGSAPHRRPGAHGRAARRPAPPAAHSVAGHAASRGAGR